MFAEPARLPTTSARRMDADHLMLAVAVTLLVLGALAFTLVHLLVPGSRSPTPAENAAKAFYSAVRQQDYQTAYNLLAAEQQAKITQYSFNLVAQEQDAKNGAVTAFHEVRSDRDTNRANEDEVQIAVTRNSGTYTIVLTMIQEPDGSWKVLEENRPI